MEDRFCPVTALQHFLKPRCFEIIKNQKSTLVAQTSISEFGTPGPLEPKGVQASVQAEEDAQDLKSCEGFPGEGSSPSPGTLLTRVSAKLSLPDSPSKYPNCA